ncbi:MAG: thermonuclease family protein [Magnetococcales bacterium]|nr:thermonuclease family protein [Magnetococcales bacterium]
MNTAQKSRLPMILALPAQKSRLPVILALPAQKSRLPMIWILPVLALSFFPATGASEPQTSFPIVGTATVLDGDTLLVNGQKIRLHGVDAWEHGQTCPDEAGKPLPCGDMATSFLKKMVAGVPLYCLPLLRDKYRRHVGHCLLLGRDLGWILVEQGWGVAYTRYDDYYRQPELQAKNQHLGGWQGFPRYEPIPPEKWRIADRSKPSLR